MGLVNGLAQHHDYYEFIHLELAGFKVADEVEWDLYIAGLGSLPCSRGRIIAIVEGYLVIHNEGLTNTNPTQHAVVCKWPHEIRHVGQTKQ